MSKSRPRLIAWALEAFCLLLIVKTILEDPSPLRLLLSVAAGAFAFWNTELTLRKYLKHEAQAPHPLTVIEFLAVVLLAVLAAWTLWSGVAAHARSELLKAVVDWSFGLAMLWICWKSLFPKRRDGGEQ